MNSLHRFRRQLGFTLLELMAAMAVFALLLVILFAAFNQASKAWLQSENRVETFTNARAALDLMSRELSLAMVTTNVSFLANIDSLAFVAAASTSTNDGVDLIEVVYRLSYAFGSDPIFNNATAPFKLVRRTSGHIPGGPCQNYYGGGGGCPNAWDFYNYLDWPETSDPTNTAIVAENVVSVRYKFYDIAGDAFDYWNSAGVNAWCNEIGGGTPCVRFNPPGQPAPTYVTNRAPAGVKITLGVIDSRAARRLAAVGGIGTAAGIAITNQATQYFSTFVSIPNRQP